MQNICITVLAGVFGFAFDTALFEEMAAYQIHRADFVTIFQKHVDKYTRIEMQFLLLICKLSVQFSFFPSCAISYQILLPAKRGLAVLCY